MRILIVGDPHGILPKKIPNNIDLILITGDLGKADLARKMYLGKNREEKDLIKKDPLLQRKIWMEIYSSSVKVIRYFSKIAQTYSILGNVGTSTDKEIKKIGKQLGINLPLLRLAMKQTNGFHLVKNGLRNFNGLRVGFLDYFIDVCWIKEFGSRDRERIKNSKKGTAKAKKILKRFGKVDVLICHQPPLGYLDKVNSKLAPKSWKGKHAGSKVILDYVKKKQPRYVFCGHIHEGKGNVKIGKTEVYNLGSEGDFVLLSID